jgi:hypothetical protein
MQEVQTKAQIPTVLDKTNQPFGNHIILSTALELISVAGQTYLKGLAGYLDEDAFLFCR